MADRYKDQVELSLMESMFFSHEKFPVTPSMYIWLDGTILARGEVVRQAPGWYLSTSENDPDLQELGKRKILTREGILVRDLSHAMTVMEEKGAGPYSREHKVASGFVTRVHSETGFLAPYSIHWEMKDPAGQLRLYWRIVDNDDEDVTVHEHDGDMMCTNEDMGFILLSSPEPGCQADTLDMMPSPTIDASQVHTVVYLCMVHWDKLHADTVKFLDKLKELREKLDADETPGGSDSESV